MAWTELTRAQHNRKTARYPSDLKDEEWAVVCPLLPGPNRLGRPRTVDLRQVWNAIQYIAAAGCAWSLLPRDFPPVSTVRYYFYRWRDDGLLAEINRTLVAQARQAAGREAQPTAGVVDSQSVKTSENSKRRLRPIGFGLARCFDGADRAPGSSLCTTQRGPYVSLSCRA
jgi:transposase